MAKEAWRNRLNHEARRSWDTRSSKIKKRKDLADVIRNLFESAGHPSKEFVEFFKVLPIVWRSPSTGDATSVETPITERGTVIPRRVAEIAARSGRKSLPKVAETTPDVDSLHVTTVANNE